MTVEPTGAPLGDGGHSEQVERPTLRATVTEATRRVEAILDAAERVAADIQADAQREAQEFLDERRREAERATDQRATALAQIAAGIGEDIGRLEGQLTDAARSLEAARERLRAIVNAEPPTSPLQAATTVDGEQGESTGLRPIAYPGTSRRSAGSGEQSVPEEALLRATQMAVAGNDRPEIERTLAAEFDITDSHHIIDELLGPPGS